MAFVKLVKTNAYFSRYQTKYRRRREGKTDYYARKRLITQDKDKYLTPKYRLVVRITCTRIIAQITYSKIKGDATVCQATSQELKRWGLTAGLTNYASAYATGLLIARRLLKNLKMDSVYKGQENVDGELYEVEAKDERRPFTAVLDIGLAYTTTGHRVFGVAKGAADGGLLIPHSERRFPGFQAGEEDEPDNYDVKAHRDRIFGCHVDKYIQELKSDADAYKKQFSKWDECLKKTGAKSVEALYTDLHKKIRANPDFVKSKGDKGDVSKRIRRTKRLTKKERDARVQKKLAKIRKAMGKK